jgi:adenylate cyclase
MRRSAHKAPGRKASRPKRANSAKGRRGKQDSASNLRQQLKRCTAELVEARAQQTATADVLKVISRSAFDLQPILNTLVRSAIELCNASTGVFFLREGDLFHLATVVGSPPAFVQYMRDNPLPLNRSTSVGRAASSGKVEHLPDVLADPEYQLSEGQRLGGYRTLLAVPLLRDGEVIGVFSLARRDQEPFTQRQIDLVTTFADQALIAVQNVRLFEEVQARTRELSESLQQQTATSEVLQVISSSPGDLAPVFDKMLENATRVCGAEFGSMILAEGDSFRQAALYNAPAAFAAVRANKVFDLATESAPSRAIRNRQAFQIEDVRLGPGYLAGAQSATELVELGGARSVVVVPMLRDDEAIGAITVYRQEVRPFDDKQIDLLKNFASQAVIAIENTRLLKELRERTDQVAQLNRGLEARVAEQVEELGRVGRLKRFLAPQLAELIVSRGDEKILESHRREIVVVFCDLRGYTAFTETAEPEEVLDFLRKYHGTLGPLVSQFEGTLDQFSGDGIMVFFNDPVPIPDPAERAVKMAIAMREAASTLIAAWRERGRELGFGAGIARGYATLGQIGFSERSGYTAIGTVCNVAARLCGEAKDGQILLSQHVNVTLKGSVATEQVGALALKGLAHPVVTYNVPLTAGQPALRVIDGGNH